jgi:hypothetical protein
VWRYSDGVADYSRGACARSGDPLGALNRVALRDDAPCARASMYRDGSARPLSGGSDEREVRIGVKSGGIGLGRPMSGSPPTADASPCCGELRVWANC